RVRGGLCLSTAIVTYRLAMMDEEALRGRGRSMVGTAVLFLVGGLAVAEVPPFGTSIGKTLIEDAAGKAGLHWVPWVFGVAAAVSGGAILRATGRIFAGLGPDEPSRFASERLGEEDRSEEERHGRDPTPALLF